MASIPRFERHRRLDQFRLLGQLAPLVNAETSFALKGGTALNVFWYDLPRLSVDLDLTFLPRVGRPEFLALTGAALNRLQTAISDTWPDAILQTKPFPGSTSPGTLFLQNGGVQVKLEVNPVHRESIYPTENRPVMPAAQPLWGPTPMKLLSFAETCAGKFNAALDRQHPRDLFDVGVILDGDCLDDRVRTAFVVNLLTQSRPFAHTLSPQIRPPRGEALSSLEELTGLPSQASDLTRNLLDLKHVLCDGMPPQHREFLVSFTLGTPDWSLLAVDRVADLPAIRWRQQQMASLPPARREELVTWLRSLWTDTTPRFPPG